MNCWQSSLLVGWMSSSGDVSWRHHPVLQPSLHAPSQKDPRPIESSNWKAWGCTSVTNQSRCYRHHTAASGAAFARGVVQEGGECLRTTFEKQGAFGSKWDMLPFVYISSNRSCCCTIAYVGRFAMVCPGHVLTHWTSGSVNEFSLATVFQCSANRSRGSHMITWGTPRWVSMILIWPFISENWNSCWINGCWAQNELTTSMNRTGPSMFAYLHQETAGFRSPSKDLQAINHMVRTRAPVSATASPVARAITQTPPRIPPFASPGPGCEEPFAKRVRSHWDCVAHLRWILLRVSIKACVKHEPKSFVHVPSLHRSINGVDPVGLVGMQ